MPVRSFSVVTPQAASVDFCNGQEPTAVRCWLAVFIVSSCIEAEMSTALPVVEHLKAAGDFVSNEERSHWH